MSCIFIVTPFVVSNWATLAALIGASAASMGYKAVQSTSKDMTEEETEQSVKLSLANSEVIAEQMRRGESMTLTKDEIRLILSLMHPEN